jgi:hypothetical protein
MAVKRLTVKYLCALTGLSVDALAHKIGFHTNHAYRLFSKDKDVLDTSRARSALAILEEFKDTPFISISGKNK